MSGGIVFTVYEQGNMSTSVAIPYLFNVGVYALTVSFFSFAL